MTSKVNTGKFSCQYGYDLRNRLASANITRKEGLQDVTITSSYAYNVDGIRTRALQTINGITQNRYFLLDDGHTGYAQVFEETSTLGANVVRSYILGDDVLSQNVNGVISYLLYDGHGSTRQLAGDDGGVTANYAYDAYGKMLGGNPGVTDGKQSATDLLYAGEQFDPGLQMEYLRARYYDQDNGRFNRLDPFDGNSEDPQSLHKYAYAHCDPVNGIDPSGEMFGFILSTIFRSIELGVKLLPTIKIATTVSGVVMILGFVGIICEQVGLIPDTPYPEIATLGGTMLFSFGISATSFFKMFEQAICPVTGPGKIMQAAKANETLAGKGFSKPPFKPGTFVAQAKANPNESFVRVFNSTKNSPEGAFIAPREEVVGKTPAEVQARLALPFPPLIPSLM